MSQTAVRRRRPAGGLRNAYSILVTRTSPSSSSPPRPPDDVVSTVSETHNADIPPPLLHDPLADVQPSMTSARRIPCRASGSPARHRSSRAYPAAAAPSTRPAADAATCTRLPTRCTPAASSPDRSGGNCRNNCRINYPPRILIRATTWRKLLLRSTRHTRSPLHQHFRFPNICASIMMCL